MTNIVDLGNDIYDLDKEELAIMEKYTKFLANKEDNDNKL